MSFSLRHPRFFSLLGVGLGLVLVSGTGCAVAPDEDASESSTAAQTACQTINGIQVCGGFLGQYQQWRGPFPKVGLPKMEAFEFGGDRFQVFERVIMNEGRGLTLPDGRPVCNGACISFAGQIDAESSLNTKLGGGETTNCSNDALQRRGLGCVPGAVRGEIESNFLYYGYMISRVVPSCEWWDNGSAPRHTECFWTERAKIGRAPNGLWEYEALGWKLLEQGKIAGAKGKRGPGANCNADTDCQSGKCSEKAGGVCSPEQCWGGARDTGVCGCARHEQLQNAVHDACDTVPQSCSPGACCSDVHRAIGNLKACVAARRQITQECFRGNEDDGHRIARENKEKNLADCIEIRDTNGDKRCTQGC